MRDLCDVAYVLQVQQLERHALAMLAAGHDVDPDEMRAAFDVELGTAQRAPVVLASERGRQMYALMGGA